MAAAGLPALQSGEPGQVRKEAATAGRCECRGSGSPPNSTRAMSYQVLARKWRPRDFASLVGQEHVVRALRHALEHQRLHHAYLFTGTRGVGKTTLARILAKCLNCETGITAQPCNKCSGHAFNAMLKTLEEPPEHMKFILATTGPQKIPVTVLSRCLQFNLKQMPREAIVEHLVRILQAEKIAFESEALALIARAAAGSMRDALSLLDQAIAHGGGKVAAASVGDMLGTIDQSHLARLLEAVAAGDAAEIGRASCRERV